MASTTQRIFHVEMAEAGLRLDAMLALRLPDHSRSHIARLIRQGCVRIGGSSCKPGQKLKPYQSIAVDLPAPAPCALAPEAMHLEVLYEDAAMIVVNKAAGVVVHPAAGHATGTLVHGLLHHCPDLEGIGGERRPGIVHRLDKETSGVLVVAKHDAAHQHLTAQFKARTITKEYVALVAGTPAQDQGSIDLPVGRHPQDRKRMSTVTRSGRSALTLWRVSERFPGAALLTVDLKTGRTHQIRVHCQAMGHPVIGDKVYGRARQIHALTRPWPQARTIIGTARRQMLHARRLTLEHPVSGSAMTFTAPLPADMAQIRDRLRMLSHPEG